MTIRWSIVCATRNGGRKKPVINFTPGQYLNAGTDYIKTHAPRIASRWSSPMASVTKSAIRWVVHGMAMIVMASCHRVVIGIIDPVSIKPMISSIYCMRKNYCLEPSVTGCHTCQSCSTSWSWPICRRSFTFSTKSRQNIANDRRMTCNRSLATRAGYLKRPNRPLSRLTIPNYTRRSQRGPLNFTFHIITIWRWIAPQWTISWGCATLSSSCASMISWNMTSQSRSRRNES